MPECAGYVDLIYIFWGSPRIGCIGNGNGIMDDYGDTDTPIISSYSIVKLHRSVLFPCISMSM